MPEGAEARLERLVGRLLRGRRLKVGSADAADRGAILAAARLAAARERYPRLSPAFRRRLSASLRGRPDGGLTRRTALVAGAAAALGTLGGLGLGRLLETPPPTAATPVRPEPGPPLQILPRPGRWVDLGALADFPEGQGVRVQAGAVGAYVFRRGEVVSAVSSICSHLPCELAWEGERGLLLCPCHGATFRPSGASTATTYPLPTLGQVMVRVVGGRVQVLGT